MRTQREEEITMVPSMPALFRRSALVGVGVAAVVLVAWAPPTEARVTRILIDTTTSPAFCTVTPPNPPVCPSFGNAGQYETIAGRAFGELDPNDPLNAIIQDIELAPKNANGNVEYMATFFLVKPIDMSRPAGATEHRARPGRPRRSS